jgi:histidyl-tRNA synthetase
LSELRKAGLRVAVDATDRKIATKLNHAEKSGVSHAVFVGEDELSSGNYKIKNLHTKEEQTLSLTSLSGYMRDHLS